MGDGISINSMVNIDQIGAETTFTRENTRVDNEIKDIYNGQKEIHQYPEKRRRSFSRAMVLPEGGFTIKCVEFSDLLGIRILISVNLQ